MKLRQKWAAIVVAAITAFYGAGPVVATHFCRSALSRDVGFWQADDGCLRHRCCRHSSDASRAGIYGDCCDENVEVYQLDLSQASRKISLSPPPVVLFAGYAAKFCALFSGAPQDFDSPALFSPPLLRLTSRLSFLQVFRF
ncbi:MAG: hypothetical protein RMM53_13010 [Bacteroidia bacterium]|nr:hypothetical protein [Bacteroidia bacterium]MDW8335127.1 hypothetical protein [Bacteroidia bacterium]